MSGTIFPHIRFTYSQPEATTLTRRGKHGYMFVQILAASSLISSWKTTLCNLPCNSNIPCIRISHLASLQLLVTVLRKSVSKRWFTSSCWKVCWCSYVEAHSALWWLFQNQIIGWSSTIISRIRSYPNVMLITTKGENSGCLMECMRSLHRVLIVFERLVMTF